MLHCAALHPAVQIYSVFPIMRAGFHYYYFQSECSNAAMRVYIFDFKNSSFNFADYVLFSMFDKTFCE